VFSMHDADELAALLRAAGFADVAAQARPLALRFPAPADFLWQYIGSTPLAGRLGEASPSEREAFEQDVCAQWQAFAQADGAMKMRVGITTARGVCPPAREGGVPYGTTPIPRALAQRCDFTTEGSLMAGKPLQASKRPCERASVSDDAQHGRPCNRRAWVDLAS